MRSEARGLCSPPSRTAISAAREKLGGAWPAKASWYSLNGVRSPDQALGETFVSQPCPHTMDAGASVTCSTSETGQHQLLLLVTGLANSWEPLGDLEATPSPAWAPLAVGKPFLMITLCNCLAHWPSDFCRSCP